MSDHETWNELGNLYFMGGAYEPAIHAYLRSIQLNKKFGRSYSNLAMAFVHTGKYTEAIKFYRRSLELLPDAKERSITWNRLGILYRQMKDYENALEAYRQADELQLQENGDRDGMSKLPLTVSMPDVDLNAVLDSSQPVKENKKPAPLERLNGILKSGIGKLNLDWLAEGYVPIDPEKVREAMNAPRTEAPARGVDLTSGEDPDGFIESGSGSVESTSGEFIGSGMMQYAQTMSALPELVPVMDPQIEILKAAVAKNPRNLSALEALGDAYKAAGLYRDAIQTYEAAIPINSANPENHYLLGLCYEAERMENEAVQEFEKVLILDPHHALAHAKLGSHYHKIGKHELGEKHIKKALANDFEKQNEYNRACLQVICGNTDSAFELLTTALQTKLTTINWVVKDPDLDALHKDKRFQTLLSEYAASV